MSAIGCEIAVGTIIITCSRLIWSCHLERRYILPDLLETYNGIQIQYVYNGGVSLRIGELAIIVYNVAKSSMESIFLEGMFLV